MQPKKLYPASRSMRVTTKAWHGNGSCNPQAAGWAGEGNLAERSDCVPERRLSQTNNCHRTRVPACFCGRHLTDAHLLSVALLASIARTFCQSSLQDRWTGLRMPLNTVIAVALGLEAIHSLACLANAIAPFRSSLTNAHLRNCLISHAIHALLHQLHCSLMHS